MIEEQEIPRRIRIDLNTPAELAIRNAMLEVEKLTADVRLTEAVCLLSKAKDYVADFVDNIERAEADITVEQIIIDLKYSLKKMIRQWYRYLDNDDFINADSSFSVIRCIQASIISLNNSK